jgi:hypothetical protein
MRAYSPTQYLGIRFLYYDEGDEKILDESLHYELHRIHHFIKALCESFYTWEILDEDQKSEYSTRPYTSVWIPLDGIPDLPRKDYPKYNRIFELEVSIISEDSACFTVFEDVTEDRDEAPFRYQEVATADFEIARLGLRARDRFRPATGDDPDRDLSYVGP